MRSTLILLAILVLMGACTSEEATQEGQRGPMPGDNALDYCSPPNLFDDIDEIDPPLRVGWRWEDHIHWSTDGSRILFTFGDLYSIGAVGVPQSKIIGLVDGFDPDGQDSNGNRELDIVITPDRDLVWGDDGFITYVDVSPDSSRFVLSTCAYTEVTEQELEQINEDWRDYSLIVTDLTPQEIGQLGEDWWDYIYIALDNNSGDAKEAKGERIWVYDFEIFVSNIDGTNVERLRENIRHIDTFSVWSPDGSRIAFIPNVSTLTIYAVETGSFEELALWTENVRALQNRPTWSPDGERIAFVGRLNNSPDWRIPGLYTIKADGSELTRISDAASGPAWSPDGQQIAIVVPELDGHALYTFAPNGTNPVLVTDNLPEPWRDPIDPWLGDLAWSPDGSEILLKGFTYRVPLDGSPPISSPLTFIDRDGNSQVEIPMDAAWSPDGSTLAVRIDEWFGWQWSRKSLSDYSSLVFMIDKDNSNIHPLVEYTETEESPYSLEAELRLAE